MAVDPLILGRIHTASLPELMRLSEQLKAVLAKFPNSKDDKDILRDVLMEMEVRREKVARNEHTSETFHGEPDYPPFFNSYAQDKIRDSFDLLGKLIHGWACDKGWWHAAGEDQSQPPENKLARSAGDMYSNFHAEISEAWEEYRKYGWRPERFMYRENGKPEGIAVELADVLIRIFDTCAAYDVPLADALILKMAYNTTRPQRHGGKLA